MKKDDFFKGMYDDFFGIGEIEKENEKLRDDIKNLKGIDVEELEENIPSIEISQEEIEKKDVPTVDKDKFMEEVFKKIDEFYIEEESKNTLKKIVEYIRKYNEKIEKQFISFNMNIYANNKETFEGVLRVLNDSINFFEYLPKGDIGIISCYDIQNAEDIAKIYSSDNNIIAFNSFNGLYSKDLNDKAKIINKLEECISEYENKYLTILYAQNKDELNDLFLSSDKIKSEFAEFNIIGRTPDVQEAYNEILEILNKNSGRILYNIYQAQLYRIQELLDVITPSNRNIVIMGKRLESIIIKAIDMGYVTFDKNRILSIRHVTDEGVVVLISDEREKAFSNLQRIVNGYDKFIKIDETDTVIFASPVYDGMEHTATKIQDSIAKIGANIVELPRKKYPTLHASSEDLMLMIDLMKPKYYMPVIGEYKEQVANANAAKEVGMSDENILLRLNGEVTTFENGKLIDNGEKIQVDDILIDGLAAGDVGDLVIKDRELLSENGIVIVTATLDKKQKKY